MEPIKPSSLIDFVYSPIEALTETLERKLGMVSVVIISLSAMLGSGLFTTSTGDVGHGWRNHAGSRNLAGLSSTCTGNSTGCSIQGGIGDGHAHGGPTFTLSGHLARWLEQ